MVCRPCQSNRYARRPIMECVTRVIPHEDFHLEITFDTGETKLFDMHPYLDKGVFRSLQDPALFKQAFVALDTVCWPGNLDIAPETLYDLSVPVGVRQPGAA